MFITYAVFMVIGVIVLVVDLVAGIGLIVTVADAMWLTARGTGTTGTVTRVEDRKPGRAARVQVSYQTPGGTFTTQGTSQRPWVGSPVPVRYNPDKPTHATTVTRPWPRALTGIPAVLLTAVAAAGMIVSGTWYYSGTHTSLQVPLIGGSVALGVALMCAVHASRRYAIVLHERRMIRVDGKVRRYAGHSPVGPGLLVSFSTPDGDEEFWVRAGTIPAEAGDAVSVRYSPDRPATTATVQEAEDVRSAAIMSTAVAIGCAAFALYLYSLL